MPPVWSFALNSVTLIASQLAYFAIDMVGLADAAGEIFIVCSRHARLVVTLCSTSITAL